MKIIQLIVLCLTLSLTAIVKAQSDFPTKPITLVVPYQAGSTPDSIGRFIGLKLGDLLKQPVVIENRPGAGGMIGTAAAARSAADGYTIVMLTPQNITHRHINKNPPVDVLTDFYPIQMIGSTASAVTVASDHPAKTLDELFRLLKEAKSVNYGSGGVGSQGHLGGLAIANLGELKAVHVPYQGAPASTSALLGHQLDYVVSTISPVLPLVQAGKLRALAVTSRERIASLPSVPTVIEQIPSGFVLDSWYLLAAPRGTPALAMEKIAKAIAEVMQQPAIETYYASIGVGKLIMPVAEIPEFLRNEDRKIGKWIKDANVLPK